MLPNICCFTAIDVAMAQIRESDPKFQLLHQCVVSRNEWPISDIVFSPYIELMGFMFWVFLSAAAGN